jgi:hypothetical protein
MIIFDSAAISANEWKNCRIGIGLVDTSIDIGCRYFDVEGVEGVEGVEIWYQTFSAVPACWPSKRGSRLHPVTSANKPFARK